jgi:hypothetical protein
MFKIKKINGEEDVVNEWFKNNKNIIKSIISFQILTGYVIIVYELNKED